MKKLILICVLLLFPMITSCYSMVATGLLYTYAYIDVTKKEKEEAQKRAEQEKEEAQKRAEQEKEEAQKRAEQEKIEEEKRVARENARARISKKYNRPWCDKSSISEYIESSPYQKRCLIELNSSFYVFEQSPHGTLVSAGHRSRAYLIERNNTDSSLPDDDVIPGGILEYTGLYQYISIRGGTNTVLKFKRLQ